MADLDESQQRALVFAQGCAIRALCSTHPNPAALARAFVGYVDELIGTLEKTGQSPEFLGAVRLHADAMIKYGAGAALASGSRLRGCREPTRLQTGIA